MTEPDSTIVEPSKESSEDTFQSSEANQDAPPLPLPGDSGKDRPLPLSGDSGKDGPLSLSGDLGKDGPLAALGTFLQGRSRDSKLTPRLKAHSSKLPQLLKLRKSANNEEEASETSSDQASASAPLPSAVSSDATSSHEVPKRTMAQTASTLGSSSFQSIAGSVMSAGSGEEGEQCPSPPVQDPSVGCDSMDHEVEKRVLAKLQETISCMEERWKQQLQQMQKDVENGIMEQVEQRLAKENQQRDNELSKRLDESGRLQTDERLRLEVQVGEIRDAQVEMRQWLQDLGAQRIQVVKKAEQGLIPQQLGSIFEGMEHGKTSSLSAGHAPSPSPGESPGASPQLGPNDKAPYALQPAVDLLASCSGKASIAGADVVADVTTTSTTAAVPPKRWSGIPMSIDIRRTSAETRSSETDKEDADMDAIPRQRGLSYFLPDKAKLIRLLSATLPVIFTAVLFMKPFLTTAVLVKLIIFAIFAAAEVPLIRVLKGEGSSEEGELNFPSRMLLQCLRAMHWLRSSHETEQKTLALLAAVSVLLLLINPDAGSLTLLRHYFTDFQVFLLLALILITTTAMAHSFMQVLHWRQLQRGPHSNQKITEGSQAVLECIAEFRTAIQQRGRSSRRAAEKRIHEILQRADQFLLNDLLTRIAGSDVSLALVLSFVKDHQDHLARTKIIDLLCHKRVKELSVHSKSAVLHALMSVRLSSCDVAEEAVESLILNTKGDELSELKSVQDAGNVHSLHKLVFEDITNSEIQQRILDHCLAEGTAQVAHRTLLRSLHVMTLLRECQSRDPDIVPLQWRFLVEDPCPTPGGSEKPKYQGHCGHQWLKIFTDIDDTLECSGGLWPAGIDKRLPRHAPYPGVFAFYKELQGGGTTGQLVALSARPHLVGDLMEQSVFSKMSSMMEMGLHCMPSLLLGSADAGANFVLRGGDQVGMQALAKKKLEKFAQYLSLYPEFKIVFIGDNGQADYAVAQMIYDGFPHVVEQVFIHEVAPRVNTFGWSEFDRGAPVHFFEDYISAAVAAATRPTPLVTLEGLKRIIAAADADFERIKWHNEAARLAMRQQLDQSKTKAVEVIKAREPKEPQSCSPEPQVISSLTNLVAQTPPKASPKPTPPASPQGIKAVHDVSQTPAQNPKPTSTNVFSRHLQAVGDLLRASEPKEPISPKAIEKSTPQRSSLNPVLSPVTGPDEDPEVVPGVLDLTKLEDVAHSMETIQFQLTGDLDNTASGPDADAAGGTISHR